CARYGIYYDMTAW
nr:immunoglobulin heavy chain junction region [Mus musculus]